MEMSAVCTSCDTRADAQRRKMEEQSEYKQAKTNNARMGRRHLL